MRKQSEVWFGFFIHFTIYIFVIGALGITKGIDVLTPMTFWGIGVLAHLWHTITASSRLQINGETTRTTNNSNKQQLNNNKTSTIFSHSDKFPTDKKLRAYYTQVEAYHNKIKAMPDSHNSKAIQQSTTQHVTLWVYAIKELIKRVDLFYNDVVIQQDKKLVPQAIQDLKQQLSYETNPTIKIELEQALTNRYQQLTALETLDTTMKRAIIQIENTLSSLGTIYSQLLTGQSANQVADYRCMAINAAEETRRLQDYLEALEEVRLNQQY